jgi:3-hydroxyisobutyrate dehydrogenase-like beta-hydroxyacid dehydrogenase
MTEHETIAIFHPGEMGAAVGACLVGRGHRVLWASSGRSVASAARADAAGLEDAVTFERALEQAQVVLSICPPHGAAALARKVAQAGFRGVFVDCNAIAPETARAEMEIAEGAGARFVDGGIVGPPPRKRGSSRLYLSGGPSREIAALFAGTNLEAVLLDGPAGAASALKACYAAWTKGTTALLAAIRALARQKGVEAALLEEWKRSQPDVPGRSGAVVAAAGKAWRWIGEMEEIAATFRAAGLPEGFLLSAAQIYGRLEGFKDTATPPSLDEIVAALANIRSTSNHVTADAL